MAFTDDFIDLTRSAELTGWEVIWEDKISNKQIHRHIQIVKNYIKLANETGFLDICAMQQKVEDWKI